MVTSHRNVPAAVERDRRTIRVLLACACVVGGSGLIGGTATWAAADAPRVTVSEPQPIRALVSTTTAPKPAQTSVTLTRPPFRTRAPETTPRPAQGSTGRSVAVPEPTTPTVTSSAATATRVTMQTASPTPATTPPAAPTLLDLVNADRAANGCPPVTAAPDLMAQAQAWSEQQAADDAMSHSAGVSGFDTWGENVAYGYATAAEAHAGWMGSPPHRENVLRCEYTLIGWGSAVSATGIPYWTEQFAA